MSDLGYAELSEQLPYIEMYSSLREEFKAKNKPVPVEEVEAKLHRLEKMPYTPVRAREIAGCKIALLYMKGSAA